MIKTNALELQLVRETLEGLLAPQIAASVICEALKIWGASPPKNTEDLLRFSQGPLRATLGRWVSKVERDEIVVQLVKRMGITIGTEIPFAHPNKDMLDFVAAASNAIAVSIIRC